MIKSLTLSNFQSHPSTTIEFSPGINAIVGASDKGKSATLRGFEWVRTNRPNGEAHISDWAFDSKGKQSEECRVIVETDKHRIERVRHGKVNGYVLDGATIEAMKGDLPSEVTAAFGLLDLNVQKQLDGPFLLSQSGGDVARFFNSLVNLEEIDHCMSAADGLKREVMADIRKTGEAIESARAKVESFSWVDAARSALGDLKNSILERDVLDRRLQVLRAALETRERLSAIVQGATSVRTAREALASLRDTTRAAEVALQRRNALRTVLARREDAQRVVATQDKVREASDALVLVRESARGIAGVSTRLNRVADILARIRTHNSTLEKVQSFRDARTALDSSKEILRDRERKASRLATIQALLTARGAHEKVLSDLAGIKEISLVRLREFLRLHREKKARLDGILGLLERREKFYTYIDGLKVEVAELKAQLPEVCPTCHRPYRRDS